MSRKSLASGRRWPVALAAGAWFGLAAKPASAHVKWFSQFSYEDQPLTLTEALTTTFWALVVLSLVTVAALVLLDRSASQQRWYQRIDQWMAGFSGSSWLVMRVGAFAMLLLCWQAEVLLALELDQPNEWVGWLQFVAALLLLFGRTTPIAGAMFIGMYFYAMVVFGVFHMLDYLMFIGVGYFLIVGGSKRDAVRESSLPVLYSTVGFCLMWLAAEKVIYPQWGLYILQGHPVLTMGLDHRFFLLGCALIEFSLGYLLLVCLFERPLALTITLTFFLTSMVFGRREVIGHTIIHTALVVFLIEGAGKHYRPPIKYPRQLGRRVAAAVAVFMVLLMSVLVPYAYGAAWQHGRAAAGHGAGHGAAHQPVDVTGDEAMSVTLEVSADAHAGWNGRLQTVGFRFTPEAASKAHVTGEGHAHLYIDGRKAGRLYGPWFHIESLPPGRRTVRVTLNANSHGVYRVDGEPVAAEVTVDVPRR